MVITTAPLPWGRAWSPVAASGRQWATATVTGGGQRRRHGGMPALLDYHEADIDGSTAAFREVFGDDFAAVEADYLATFPRVAVGTLVDR